MTSKKTIKIFALIWILFSCVISFVTQEAVAFAERVEPARDSLPHRYWLAVEGGLVWQAKNNVQIPKDTGTRFSLTDFGSGGSFAGRVYFGYRLSERHELRALYAPLSLTVNGASSQAIVFQGATFAAGVPLEGRYQFNSYRLTYRYTFHQSERWLLKVGFTAKIRDAEIRLSQPGQTASRANVGFVPLLHFAAIYQIDANWFVLADLDALAAPQGRAEDFALVVGRQVTPELKLTAGYRTVEGGSSGGGGVYNFAWLNYATFGFVWEF